MDTVVSLALVATFTLGLFMGWSGAIARYEHGGKEWACDALASYFAHECDNAGER